MREMPRLLAAFERAGVRCVRRKPHGESVATRQRYSIPVSSLISWQDLLRRFDVLLTPVAATAAFPHDHNPDREQRLVPVNGKPVPYADQLFWAGLASLS
jgi:Asp-tRNA(Asn)/Glu-tRNA(Gln) amidotransferase A subunit family amidase